MVESSRSARGYVSAEDGTQWTFGEFLEQRRRLSGKSVQDVAKEAKISRANYYLLKGDEQRPTLSTAVALFSALGLRCEVPQSDDGLEMDLHIYDGAGEFFLILKWTADDRSRARDRYLSSAGLGAGAALGGMGLGGVAAAALGGAVGAAALPVAGPLAASVFIAARQMKKAREQQRMQQQRDDQEAKPAPAKHELIEDFKAAADEMSTEDLEALLAAMKALRESNSD